MCMTTGRPLVEVSARRTYVTPWYGLEVTVPVCGKAIDPDRRQSETAITRLRQGIVCRIPPIGLERVPLVV